MPDSPLFKAPIVRQGLRRKRTSLRNFRRMSNTAIRRYVNSTAFDPSELGEAVRARGVHTPWFRDGRRTRGKGGGGAGSH